MVNACFVFALGESVFRFKVADSLLVPTDDRAAGKEKQEEKAEDCDKFFHDVARFVIFLIQIPVPFEVVFAAFVVGLIDFFVIA